MTLAELVIRLSADTASLRSDFEKGKAYAQGFASDVSKIFSTIGASLPGLSVAGITTELMNMAESTAKVGEQIYKMEDLTGMGAETLSGLRAIASESSESFEGLSGTLTKFGKNIEGAFISPTSAAGKVLHALFDEQGVNALKLEPMSQRLEEVTKKVFGLTDSAEKDYAAAALFGRGWTENAETLRKFGEEGEKVADFKAKMAGIGMTEEDIKRAHEFLEIWKMIDLSMQGVAQTLGGVLIPIFTSFVQPTMKLSDQLDLRGKYKNTFWDISPDFDNPDGTPRLQGQTANAGLPSWAQGLHVAPLHPSLTDAMSAAPKVSAGKGEKGLSDLAHDMAEFSRGQAEVNALLKEMNLYVTPLNEALGKYDERLIKIMELPQGIAEGPLRMMNIMKLGLDIDNLANANPALQLQGSQQNAKMARSAGNFQIPQLSEGLGQLHERFAVLDADAFQFGEKASSAFTSMIIHGKSMAQMLNSFIDLFGEFMLKTFVFQNLSQTLGQNGKSPLGVLGSFFAGLAGGRASGGPVDYGQSYLVGEQGPEIFTPGASGQITPNSAARSGGGGRGGDIYVDARNADGGVEYRAQRGIAAGMRQAAINGYLLTAEMAKRGA